MIQTGGEALSDFFQRNVTSPVTNLRGEMERTFERVLHRGEAPAGEHAEVGEEESSDAVDGRQGVVREFMTASGQAIEEWQRRIDDQVHKVLSTMTQLPSLGSDVQGLRDRIAELEQQVQDIESSEPPQA